ncbi:hypothetical protein Q7P37_001539 [Cladosporium fusiforme]
MDAQQHMKSRLNALSLKQILARLLYTTASASKSAILPDPIIFADGVVLPFALEAAVCALSPKEPGVAMPGVSTPALGLSYTFLDTAPRTGTTMVVLGASSFVGSMVTQVATAACISVIAIAGPRSHELCQKSGATWIFSHTDPAVVNKVVGSLKSSGENFVGIFDSVSIRETFDIDLKILEKLNGGHLALTHPPVDSVPGNVKCRMIFAVNNITYHVSQRFVTQALQSGKLQCLPPPTVVWKGLECIQEALQMSKAGLDHDHQALGLIHLYFLDERKFRDFGNDHEISHVGDLSLYSVLQTEVNKHWAAQHPQTRNHHRVTNPMLPSIAVLLALTGSVAASPTPEILSRQAISCLAIGSSATARWTNSAGQICTYTGIVGGNYGANPSGNGDYSCMGRCGAGCSGAALGNAYTQDCYSHDVCSYFNSASGGASDPDCGGAFNAAVDDTAFGLASGCGRTNPNNAVSRPSGQPVCR